MTFDVELDLKCMKSEDGEDDEKFSLKAGENKLIRIVKDGPGP